MDSKRLNLVRRSTQKKQSGRTQSSVEEDPSTETPQDDKLFCTRTPVQDAHMWCEPYCVGQHCWMNNAAAARLMGTNTGRLKPAGSRCGRKYPGPTAGRGRLPRLEST